MGKNLLVPYPIVINKKKLRQKKIQAQLEFYQRSRIIEFKNYSFMITDLSERITIVSCIMVLKLRISASFQPHGIRESKEEFIDNKSLISIPIPTDFNVPAIKMIMISTELIKSRDIL